MERIIERILVKYYKEYTIPTKDYDTIIFEHKSANHPCDRLKHHYKCLHNPSLKWDDFDSNKYAITVTYKDIKTIILEARDSGGSGDWFGYAHDGTTMNCVVAFVGNKLGIDYGDYYTFKGHQDEEELFNICSDIYDEVTSHMNDFLISIY